MDNKMDADEDISTGDRVVDLPTQPMEDDSCGMTPAHQESSSDSPNHHDTTNKPVVEQDQTLQDPAVLALLKYNFSMPGINLITTKLSTSSVFDSLKIFENKEIIIEVTWDEHDKTFTRADREKLLRFEFEDKNVNGQNMIESLPDHPLTEYRKIKIVIPYVTYVKLLSTQFKDDVKELPEKFNKNDPQCYRSFFVKYGHIVCTSVYCGAVMQKTDQEPNREGGQYFDLIQWKDPNIEKEWLDSIRLKPSKVLTTESHLVLVGLLVSFFNEKKSVEIYKAMQYFNVWAGHSSSYKTFKSFLYSKWETCNYTRIILSTIAIAVAFIDREPDQKIQYFLAKAVDNLKTLKYLSE